MKIMTKRLIRIVPMVALAMLLAGCGFLGWFDVGDAIAATNGLTYPVVDTGQVHNKWRIAIVTTTS